MDGWMNEYNEAMFSNTSLLDLPLPGQVFLFSLLNYFYVLLMNSFFKYYLSWKHRIFSYIFFQWYVGKAPVNISIEVDNVHFGLEKRFSIWT